MSRHWQQRYKSAPSAQANCRNSTATLDENNFGPPCFEPHQRRPKCHCVTVAQEGRLFRRAARSGPSESGSSLLAGAFSKADSTFERRPFGGSAAMRSNCAQQQWQATH